VRELPLPKCVEAWGLHPFGYNVLPLQTELRKNTSAATVSFNGQPVHLPIVAPKYLKWLRSREHICREINSMAKLRGHENIIELKEVLELIQVNFEKCTYYCEVFKLSFVHRIPSQHYF
jgi:hypothetical protein